MMWVSEELPNIFIEILKREKKQIGNNVNSKETDDIKVNVSGNLENQPLHCDRCTFVSESLQSFKTHIESKHFDCGKCAFSTAVSNEFKTHFQNTHNKKPVQHKCVKCEFVTNTKKLLTKHMEDEHSSKQLCPKCNELKGGKQIIECKSCPTITHVTCLNFLGKERVAVYKSKKELFECDVCVKKKHDISVVDPSLNVPETTLDEGIDCDECDFHTEDPDIFNEHIKSHEISCGLCALSFKTRKAFTDHEASTHVRADKTDEPNTSESYLLKSCKLLEEKILIERSTNSKNVVMIENLEAKVKALNVEVGKANERTVKVRDELIVKEDELKLSKEMMNREIVKSEKNQSEIEQLKAINKRKDEEIAVLKSKDNSNDNNQEIINVLRDEISRAKDMFLEYEHKIANITKHKDEELKKVNVEKKRLKKTSDVPYVRN